MESGRWRWFGWLGLVALASGPVLGCATGPKCLDKALLVNRDPAAHGSNPMQQYLIHCPDVLEIMVQGRPEWSGLRGVNADGRIGLTDDLTVRVDGQTPAEITAALEQLAYAPAGEVVVRVAEFSSQQLYVLSDAPGLQRVVPYRGPETVVDVLQRVGGLSSQCAPAEIQVVRAHVADGTPPEVFHVDLAAILLKQDQRTNIILQSFDQIYIGQSRQSAVLSCCPPWLKPLYKCLCGIGRREKASQQTKELMRGDQPKRDFPL
jgi:polysaccharide biosynthesis/export protein